MALYSNSTNNRSLQMNFLTPYLLIAAGVILAAMILIEVEARQWRK